MAKTDHITESVARRLSDLSASQPPLHSFNRQFARVVLDGLGAEAVSLWLVQENELVLCEQIEDAAGALASVRLAEGRQQQALRGAFERNEVAALEDGPRPFDPLRPDDAASRTIAFLPLPGLQGNNGVARIVLPGPPRQAETAVRLAETLCGYYSLYHAHHVLRVQKGQREHFDRLNKAILQLHHYSLSRQLPEIVANSAMEFAALDRAVVLLRGRRGGLEVSAVSSVATPGRKSAWARLVCELGEVVARTSEPLTYCSHTAQPSQIEDEELREKVTSYMLMTDATSLLVFPAQAGEGTVGALVLEKKGPRPLDDFEAMLCTVYATHIASALSNNQLLRRVPFARLLTRKADPAARTPARRPRRTRKATAWAAGLALVATLVWFLGFHPVPERISASCFVQPIATRVVSARIAGEIEQVLFAQGAQVDQGDVLARLRTNELELRVAEEVENIKILETQLTQLRGEAETLADSEARSERLAQATVAEHSLEARRHRLAQLRSRLEDATIRAPIGGTVLEPDDPEKLLGAVVKEGELLCRIGHIASEMLVRIAVPAERAAEVRAGQAVELRLRPLVTEEAMRATIRDVALRSVTYKNTNVFMASAVIESPVVNPDAEGSARYLLKPGMTGKAKILLPEDSTYAAIYAGRLYRKLHYALF
jgi:multidrug efflux pump subunit AcrA (membrane-fusion protein)